MEPVNNNNTDQRQCDSVEQSISRPANAEEESTSQKGVFDRGLETSDTQSSSGNRDDSSDKKVKEGISSSPQLELPQGGAMLESGMCDMFQ